MAQVTSTGGVTAPAVASTTVTSPSVKPAQTTPAEVAPSTGAAGAPTFKDDLAKATEKLQPVPHHGRAKIVAGEREGQYLNTSGNKRDGQAFTMEYHGGRRWHVYGTGADRVVIAFAKPAAKAPPGATMPADGGAPAAAKVPADGGAPPAAKVPAGGGASTGVTVPADSAAPLKPYALPKPYALGKPSG